MIFYILLVLLAIVFIGVSYMWFRGNYNLFEETGATFAILFFITFPLASPIFWEWSNQANDLGTINAQHHIIKTLEDEIAITIDQINNASYQQGALINADTPVKSMIEAVASLRQQVIEAKKEKDKAIISIEKRRHGPMSGVIRFVGDYKEAEQSND